MFNIKKECYGTLLVLSSTLVKDVTLFRVIDKIDNEIFESISYYTKRVLTDSLLIDKEYVEVQDTNIEFASAKLFKEYKKLFLLQNKTIQNKLNKLTKHIFTINEANYAYYKSYELKINNTINIKELKEFYNVVKSEYDKIKK